MIVEACYWYQQGCSIGCPTCDSVSGRVQVREEEEEKDQQRNKETKKQRSNYKSFQIDICGLGKKATINAPELRTVNRKAEAGSKLDIVNSSIAIILIISIIVTILN